MHLHLAVPIGGLALEIGHGSSYNHMLFITPSIMNAFVLHPGSGTNVKAFPRLFGFPGWEYMAKLEMLPLIFCFI
eukprot:3993455-Amphidinium_carterae.1